MLFKRNMKHGDIFEYIVCDSTPLDDAKAFMGPYAGKNELFAFDGIRYDAMRKTLRDRRNRVIRSIDYLRSALTGNAVITGSELFDSLIIQESALRTLKIASPGEVTVDLQGAGPWAGHYQFDFDPTHLLKFGDREIQLPTAGIMHMQAPYTRKDLNVLDSTSLSMLYDPILPHYHRGALFAAASLCAATVDPSWKSPSTDVLETIVRSIP